MRENVCIRLPRSVCYIRGEESESFLQGLITNDIRKATSSEALYAAMLTPQGKFLYDFFLLRVDGGFMLETFSDTAEALLKKLQMYKLRAKVHLEPAPEAIVVATTSATKGGGHCYRDPRLADMGFRTCIKEDALPAFMEANNLEEAALAEYTTHCISLGVPEAGQELLPEDGYPLHYNLHLLHGVDFSKGCYVGQEVTARMYHRDAIKKQLMVIKAEQVNKLPPAGTEITQDGNKVGMIQSQQDGIGLAIMRGDNADMQKSFYAGNVPITIRQPDYMAHALSVA